MSEEAGNPPDADDADAAAAEFICGATIPPAASFQMGRPKRLTDYLIGCNIQEPPDLPYLAPAHRVD
ncbi:MAG: hypothetical protein ACREQC_09960 [Candidatus Binataceae bacterium]